MSNFDIEIGEYEQSAEVMKNARDAIYKSLKEMEKSPDELGYIATAKITDDTNNDNLKWNFNIVLKLTKCGDYATIYFDEIVDRKMIKLEGKIDILSDSKVTSDLKLTCHGKEYVGNVKGKYLGMDLPISFKCVGDLGCEDNGTKLKIDLFCVSYITHDCSEIGFHKYISEYLDGCYAKTYKLTPYVSGWKKVGFAYRYISPTYHKSLKIEYSLNDRQVNAVLNYIFSCNLGTAVFSHSVLSICGKFFSCNALHSALNVKCAHSAYVRENVIWYVNSITRAFWRPNLSYNNRNISNFCLNRPFKISSCMCSIQNMKKDSRLFKHFPVFLYDYYQKKDIYDEKNNKAVPLEVKISSAELKKMLRSDISFIYFNALNSDDRLMEYNCNNRDLNVRESDTDIFRNLTHLIEEYIVFLEDKINDRIELKESKRLPKLHNEIYTEFVYGYFESFINELSGFIEEYAEENLVGFGLVCRHINYTDVLKFYNHERYKKIQKKYNGTTMRDMVRSFINDVTERKTDATDINFMSNLEWYRYYKDILKNLNNEIYENNKIDRIIPVLERGLSIRIDELETLLENKLKKYKKMYRYSLVMKFAHSADYDVNCIKQYHKQAKQVMTENNIVCHKNIRQYCEYLLAAMLSFTDFLKEKHKLSNVGRETIINSVMGLSGYLNIRGISKKLDEDLRTKLFCDFLNESWSESININSDSTCAKKIYAPDDISEGNYDDPMGWIDPCESNTILLIKKGEGSPVETAFRRYLEANGYDSIFVWSTFVSKNLSGNGIVKGKPVLYKNRNCKRYDYKKKIDGKQYTVYNMYLNKAAEYSAEYRRRNS